MDALIERCAGLDVHKKTVAVCLRLPGPAGGRLQHVRTVGTMTADLLALQEWLQTHQVTRGAMESTGVYWKPVYYVLEEAFTCLLVNASHMHNVPGRKPDVQDCVWIAQLLEGGLLRGSFVPPAPIRALRDLVRYRKVLTPGTQPRGPAAAHGAGGYRGEAGVGRHGHSQRIRRRDAGGLGAGHHRSRRAGRTGPRPPARSVAGVAAGPRRTRPAAPCVAG